MFLIQNYWTAIAFCIVTMVCWGSWANTQKLVDKKWRYELFYWDYVFGLLLTALIFALTWGSNGTSVGRSYIDDLTYASPTSTRTRKLSLQSKIQISLFSAILLNFPISK